MTKIEDEEDAKVGLDDDEDDEYDEDDDDDDSKQTIRKSLAA